MNTRIWLLIFLSFIVLCWTTTQQGRLFHKAIVEIKAEKGQYQLYRNGQPYFIKGICVTDYRHLQKAKESGANSVRTYDTDQAREILDSAFHHGMTVTLGLKLPYAEIEFNYGDERALAILMDSLKTEVLKYKSHPSLLMWEIGNELSLYISSSPFLSHFWLFRALEKIGKMIHELDPDHPTTTSLPYPRETTIRAVDLLCDNIDILSLNSFEELKDLPRRSKHWKKPYIIAEYGANGYWGSEGTEWHTQVEPTSNQKSAFIIEQYKILKGDTTKCMGSYAFIWGSKTEYTPTWFSMFMADGSQTEVTDALAFLWQGKYPDIRSPAIYSITVNDNVSSENIYLQPGKKYVVGFTTAKDNSEKSILEWQLQADDLEVMEMYSSPGFIEKKRRNISNDRFPLSQIKPRLVGKEKDRNHYEIILQAPDVSGPYRLFLNIQDGQKRVATANACFYVRDVE